MWGVEEIVGISGDPVRSASDRDTIGTAPRPVPRRGTGVPFPVTTRVVESEKTAKGGTHVRIEFEGPLKAWQTWDYEPSGGGTLVTAEIEYNVPGRAIGKFADRVLVERLQERAREQTLENLTLMAESWSGPSVQEALSGHTFAPLICGANMRPSGNWLAMWRERRCDMAGKFEVYEDKSGGFRFSLKAGNGETIATSESYKTKAAALKGSNPCDRAPRGRSTTSPRSSRDLRRAAQPSRMNRTNSD